MKPREALQHFHQGKLDGVHLMRILVSHGQWRMLSVQEGGQHRPLLRLVGEERWLQLFTDEDALANHLRQNQTEAQQTWVETTGEWVFTHLSADLSGVDINPQLPEAIHYKQDQLAMLRSWGRALAVERVLRERSTDAAALELLSGATFQLALVIDDANQPQIALAPDPKQRQLIAVFTAPDAAIDYVNAAKKALNRPLRIQELSGRELFSHISRMPVDGIVFNCLGPTDPIAVNLTFAQAFRQREPST